MEAPCYVVLRHDRLDVSAVVHFGPDHANRRPFDLILFYLILFYFCWVWRPSFWLWFRLFAPAQFMRITIGKRLIERDKSLSTASRKRNETKAKPTLKWLSFPSQRDPIYSRYKLAKVIEFPFTGVHRAVGFWLKLAKIDIIWFHQITNYNKATRDKANFFFLIPSKWDSFL